MTTNKNTFHSISIFLSLMMVVLSSTSKGGQSASKTEHISFTGDPDSIVVYKPIKESTTVHYYTIATRWNKQIFMLNELIKEPEMDLGFSIFGSDTESDRETYGVLSDKPSFEMSIDFSKLKTAGSPLSIGLGYERFQFSQSGFLDVDKIQQGILKNEYIGESIIMSHDLKSVYVIGALTLQEYNPAHFLGYSIHIVG